MGVESSPTVGHRLESRTVTDAGCGGRRTMRVSRNEEETMVGRKLQGIGFAATRVAALGIVAVHERDGSAGAQDLAPAAVTTGVLQLDTRGATRVFDTRIGFGLSAGVGPFAPGSSRLVFLPGVPQNAIAAWVNITVIADQPDSFGYAAALGAGAPAGFPTSNVNWNSQGVVANLAFAPVGLISTDPHITLHVEGNNPVHVVVDVQGWVLPAS
jgi:hypothetical protein